MGLTIEHEVVRTLNELRGEWDPNSKYADLIFVHRGEAFPDVGLASKSTNQIIFGIELKSWYLLAKEGEPSFRLKADPEACAPADLVMVVPWALSYVIAGTPEIYGPYVHQAKYVAEYRNYWWQYGRAAQSNANINRPNPLPKPYPPQRSIFSDDPVSDSGGNFGRIARIHTKEMMDDYVASFENLDMIGFELQAWRKFFKLGP